VTERSRIGYRPTNRAGDGIACDDGKTVVARAAVRLEIPFFAFQPQFPEYGFIALAGGQVSEPRNVDGGGWFACQKVAIGHSPIYGLYGPEKPIQPCYETARVVDPLHWNVTVYVAASPTGRLML